MTLPLTPLEPARSWLAEQIRARVIGEDPSAKADAIFNAPGPRLLPDDSPVRIVHADASMFIGGTRALLLQSLHPLAMAGVAQHSDYRADPWGRLRRTADFVTVTTYGPAAMAIEAVATVQRVHERVRGVTSDGQPYAANDPHLLRWVHIAETDSFLTAYQRYGQRRLSAGDADRYVADHAVVAELFGISEPPRTVGALRAEIERFRPELRRTRDASEAARFLLIDPPLPLVARPPYFALSAAAVGLLPLWARWMLRLPVLPVSERLVVAPAGAAMTGVIRWAMHRRPIGDAANPNDPATHRNADPTSA